MQCCWIFPWTRLAVSAAFIVNIESPESKELGKTLLFVLSQGAECLELVRAPGTNCAPTIISVQACYPEPTEAVVGVF